MTGRHRLIGLLFDHFWWKLFSLLLAAMLWLAFSNEPELTTTLGVPVEYKNVPKELDISTDVPEKVMLQLRGPRDQVTKTASSIRLAVVLDIGDRKTARAGEHTYSIGPANVELPTDVELVRAVPGQLRLTLENRLQKDVPVTLRFAGSPPPGFRVKIGEVIPERIQIVGPESRVRNIESVETDAFDLRTMKAAEAAPVEVMLNTFIADPHVSPVRTSVIRARVILEKID